MLENIESSFYLIRSTFGNRVKESLKSEPEKNFFRLYLKGLSNKKLLYKPYSSPECSNYFFLFCYCIFRKVNSD